MEEGNALIIGYGPGVGDAVAKMFAREGYSLSLIARNQEKVAEAASKFNSHGGRAQAFSADAGDDRSLTAALQSARSAFGDAEVLVYNAAFWRPGPALDLTADLLIQDLRICVAGALTAARFVAGPMRARSRGSILFTGGGLALYPSASAPSLSIGKAAIRSLSLMLASELVGSGIRVGTVTIAGTVAPNTSLSAERVAEAFLGLHRSPPDPLSAERVLKP